jgi:hypothetical protein
MVAAKVTRGKLKIASNRIQEEGLIEDMIKDDYSSPEV